MYGFLWAYSAVFGSAMAKLFPMVIAVDDNDDQADTTNYHIWLGVFACIVLPLSMLHLSEQVSFFAQNVLHPRELDHPSQCIIQKWSPLLYIGHGASHSVGLSYCDARSHGHYTSGGQLVGFGWGIGSR